jgi:hypothetical protein
MTPTSDQLDAACSHGGECGCGQVLTGTEQNLEEFDFSRSACAAAQLGDELKLRHILSKRPNEIHASGVPNCHVKLSECQIAWLALIMCVGLLLSCMECSCTISF